MCMCVCVIVVCITEFREIDIVKLVVSIIEASDEDRPAGANLALDQLQAEGWIEVRQSCTTHTHTVLALFTEHG